MHALPLSTYYVVNALGKSDIGLHFDNSLWREAFKNTRKYAIPHRMQLFLIFHNNSEKGEKSNLLDFMAYIPEKSFAS